MLPASGQVRAVFGGDGTRPRLESAPVVVKVVPSMTLTTDKRRAQGGHGVRGQRHARPRAGDASYACSSARSAAAG